VHASGGGDRPEPPQKTGGEDDGMGEFEDPWEDEEESDEEVVDGAAEDDPDGMDVDQEVLPAVEEEDEAEAPAEAFIPGHHTLGQDEELVPDQSTYEMLHRMNVNWPCLSFDVLRDNLGHERQRFPATSYIVTGTQAESAKNNEILVMKMSSLHKTQKDDDSDSDEEDDADDADNLDEDAVLEYKSIPTHGGVNRVRAQPLPAGEGLPPLSSPYFVASWSETGKVHIWNVRQHLEALDSPGYTFDRTEANSPAFTIESHRRTEGFALDWAASGSGLRLLTGDLDSKIYLTTSTPSSFNALAQPFTSHTSSIEDLQWSPSEPTVFASCSADRTVRLWDVRVKGRKCALTIDAAHESDVNVISWNKLTNYLLLSGGDEGGIKAWDLRQVKGDANTKPTPAAAFSWHNAPITAVEWHPTEDSTFVASGADDQVTLWDLGVELDDEEIAAKDAAMPEKEVPPQLLFVHQGQRDVKEVHWHPQIPGAVITTAMDGFNIFKTISV